MVNIARERRRLGLILGQQAATSLVVQAVASEEVHLSAHVADKVVHVVLNPADNTSQDLLDHAPIEAWRVSTSLATAVNRGLLAVIDHSRSGSRPSVDSVVIIPSETTISSKPIEIELEASKPDPQPVRPINPLPAHIEAVNPHTQYQMIDQKAAPYGYAGLDGNAKVYLTQLPVFNATAAGMVPSSGGGTSGFLRSDGSWVSPPGATPANSVTEGISFGQLPVVGTGVTFARVDHQHGTPEDPMPAHLGALDPHQGYQLRTEKDVSGGYPGLDSDSKISYTQLPQFTAGAAGVVGPSGGGVSSFLRADGAWVEPPRTPVPQPSASVEEGTSFGLVSSVGVSHRYAREDHSHGTPEDPRKCLISPIRTVYSDTEFLTSDHTLRVDAMMGDIQVVLPAAALCPGLIAVIRKVDATHNQVKIRTRDGDAIEGVVELSLTVRGAGFRLQSHGGGWDLLEEIWPPAHLMTNTNIKPELVIHKVFTPGLGGTPDDTILFNANAPTDFRILDIVHRGCSGNDVHIHTGIGGGGDQILLDNQKSLNIPRGGTLVLRRSDNRISGEVIIRVIQQ